MTARARRISILFALALGAEAIGVASITVAPAAAEERPTTTIAVHGTGVLPQASAELVADTRGLATALKIDFPTALRYTASTDLWDDVVADIQRADPENFATAYRNVPTAPNAHVVLISLPTAAVMSLLRSLPFDTAVEFGAQASEADLLRFMSVADTAVENLRLSIVDAGVDPRTSEIQIHVVPGTEQSLIAEANTAAVAAIQRPRVSVRVIADAEHARTNYTDHTGGGKDLHNNNSNTTPECTSGFTTVRGSVRGVTTAKHCNNGLLWGTQAGVIAFDAEATDAGVTNNIPNEVDIQFHRDYGGFVSAPTFWATGTTSNDIRSVTSHNNAVVGDFVYKFGRYGGFDGPERVTNLNQTVHVDESLTQGGRLHRYIGEARFAATSGTTFGDSGGPVFFGTVAKGSENIIETDSGNNLTAVYYVPQTRWSENLDAFVLSDN